MTAAISRNEIAPDARTGLVVVIAKDASGALTLRIEDFFGARDYGVTQTQLTQLAAEITRVVNS